LDFYEHKSEQDTPLLFVAYDLVPSLIVNDSCFEADYNKNYKITIYFNILLHGIKLVV
jgi:hypothetical protein